MVDMNENPAPQCKYKKEYDKLAKNYCLMNATDADLAKFFNVDPSTISNWKNDFPSFFEAIKEGREVADANVAHSLYRRAMGYEHKEDVVMQYKGDPVIVPTVKHYPPDTAAAFIWLKNRRRWVDKQVVEAHVVNESVIIENPDGKPIMEIKQQPKEVKNDGV